MASILGLVATGCNGAVANGTAPADGAATTGADGTVSKRDQFDSGSQDERSLGTFADASDGPTVTDAPSTGADACGGPTLIDAPATVACPDPAGTPQPVCGSVLCGNGVRDTCLVGGGPTGFDGGYEAGTPTTEPCDRNDLGDASCASLGYHGGVLSCGGWCGFDTTGCDTCATGAKILGCTRANVDAIVPTSLSLGVTDTDIVVAWISGATPAVTMSAQSGVHVARFGSDLSLLSETDCLAVTTAENVSLADSPSGWILAVGTQFGIEIHLLDRSLAPRGPTRFLPCVGQPLLTSRKLPGAAVLGGPLLTYSVAPSQVLPYPSPRQAVLLKDDGTDETAAVTLAQGTLEIPPGSSSASGVFTGSGFLYADDEETPSMVQPAWSGVAIEYVGLDGSLGARQTPVPQSTEMPELAWTGGGALLTYLDFGSMTSQVALVPLNAQGAAAGPSVTLGSVPDHYDRSPIAAFGNANLILLGGYGTSVAGSKELDIVRVSNTGALLDPSYPLVIDPSLMFEQRVQGRSSEAVIAWLGRYGPDMGMSMQGFPGRVGLARVTP